jgi:hypothetical protein
MFDVRQFRVMQRRELAVQPAPHFDGIFLITALAKFRISRENFPRKQAALG